MKKGNQSEMIQGPRGRLSLYSAVKFTISFWRQEAMFLVGLQEAQVVSLAALAFAAVLATNLVLRARHASKSGIVHTWSECLHS